MELNDNGVEIEKKNKWRNCIQMQANKMRNENKKKWRSFEFM